MAQNWFKHDYSARNDEKILELRAEYGWKGYGLFFGLVESMCETETGCIDTERIGGLSVGYGLPKDELLTFIEFCLDIELFYEDEEGLVKNKRVIEHLEHMNTLKEAGKKGAQKRWNKQKDRGANGEANNNPNADKIRLDKIREEKRRETIYVFDEFWDDYDKKKERKKCERKWKKVNEQDRELIKSFIPVYKKHQPESQYRKNPSTFLNNEIWKDDWEYYKPKSNKNGNYQSAEDFKRDLEELEQLNEVQ